MLCSQVVDDLVQDADAARLLCCLNCFNFFFLPHHRVLFWANLTLEFYMIIVFGFGHSGHMHCAKLGTALNTGWNSHGTHSWSFKNDLSSTVHPHEDGVKGVKPENQGKKDKIPQLPEYSIVHVPVLRICMNVRHVKQVTEKSSGSVPDIRLAVRLFLSPACYPISLTSFQTSHSHYSVHD